VLAQALKLNMVGSIRVNASLACSKRDNELVAVVVGSNIAQCDAPPTMAPLGVAHQGYM